MKKKIIPMAVSILGLAASLGLAYDNEFAQSSGSGTTTLTITSATVTIPNASGLTESRWTESDAAVSQKLTDRYQVSKATYTIDELRRKLGNWDEVVTALVLTQKSGQSIDQVLSLKDG